MDLKKKKKAHSGYLSTAVKRATWPSAQVWACSKPHTELAKRVSSGFLFFKLMNRERNSHLQSVIVP